MFYRINSSHGIEQSAYYCANFGTVDKMISHSFTAGAYYVYIDAWDSVSDNVSYTLKIE